MYQIKMCSEHRFNVFLCGHLVAAFARYELATAWVERRKAVAA